MTNDWKRKYAYKFNKPAINKEEIYINLRLILIDLSVEVRKIDKISAADINIKKIDENNFIIFLPKGECIKITYTKMDNQPIISEQIDFRIKNTIITITVQKNSNNYNINYVNIYSSKDKNFNEFERELDISVLDKILSNILIY